MSEIIGKITAGANAREVLGCNHINHLMEMCRGTPTQGLSQDFKNACPKQQFQIFCPSRFSYLVLIYFKSLYQLHLIAYCVKKGNLHFSYVLEDGLLGKYLVITPHKSKLKNHNRNFCLSKQVVFRKLPVQKTGRTDPG